MFRLGLTGSIATGKSTALAAFAAHGHPAFSSDDAVHELYRGAAVEPIALAFPGSVRDGAIDRQVLASQLVAQPQRLQELEQIVHPLVRKCIADFLARAEAAGSALAVIDVPLLFETGHDYGFDAVAVTWCDEDEQRRRALARPGMTVEKLATVLARQLPQAEKKARADYLIDTNGSIAETGRQVDEIVRLCLAPMTDTERET